MAIEYRSITGSGNNLTYTDANVAGADFGRIGTAHFTDGYLTPVSGVNPRTISNMVVGEGDADQANPQGVSGMMYAWGQFLDHDLDLSRSDGVNHIDIAIPNGDPNFGNGAVLTMTRAIIDPATGTDPAHPALAVNAITGWLDGSQVYGSSQAVADSLRLADGHMKTSAGNNLPIVGGMFAAGDTRAAENPSLTALQTIFVREHNYQVDRLMQEHPGWTGDQLYQQARAIVAAEIAHITYAEFLPHLIGTNAIAAYAGYNASVDPRITLEFAGAAFRFGHSIVSAETERINELGAVTGDELELKDTFFMLPAAFNDGGGADGFLRHLASDPSQKMDARIVDDLRNFLFDPPVAMDLAAINIQRGRDLGLGTLNQTRLSLGLAAYTDFAEITDDAGTVAALSAAFGTVDAIDLWTGGLSEKNVDGALLGETFRAIITRQFTVLRDGDRLWYQNQGFDAVTLAAIEHTTLSEILRRNTDTVNIQDDAFVFYSRHSGTQGGVEAESDDDPQLVIGSNGIDTLIGGTQGDILIAGEGVQTLIGNGGNDSINGGTGDDTAVFAQNLADYALADRAGVVTVIGPDGHDTVRASEHLRFADGTINYSDGSVLFDTIYYARQNLDVFHASADARAHYNTYGWHEGRDPDALFSTRGYLGANRDVSNANTNPLDHFHNFGWKEGRDPSASFDTRLYLLRNPDVAAAHIDPLEHYLQFGIAEGRTIYAAIGNTIVNGFDAEYYLLANPDVAAAGANPRQHYDANGWHEGRNPNAFFNTAYYLSHNPDVAAAGTNPLAHYEQFGWKEGRDPSAAFDSSAYLAAYADVAAAHIDPLTHYLQNGIYEGRTAFAVF